MKLSKHFLILFGLFVLAFCIRLIALNQSLWLDEGITARVVGQYNLSEILTRFLPGDFHPPLYYFIVHIWSIVFGRSEIALRMPSVIASLITGVFVYKIVASRGSRVAGQKVEKSENQLITSRSFSESWFATAFFLFNPLIVYYSQEARMYMIATMFITMGVYFVTSRGSRVASLKDGIVSGVCFSLAMATFYGSVFIIVPITIYLLFRKRVLSLLGMGCLLVVTCLILSPLLFTQLQNARSALSFVPNWRSVLGTASFKNLMLVFIKFTSGRLSFEPKTLYYLLAGIWMAIVWSGVILGGKKNKTLLFFVVSVLSLGTAFSFITPLLQYFRFIYLLPIVAVLLAMGFKNNIVRSIMLVGFFLWSVLYLLFPAFHREDWASLARLVDRSKPVYAVPSSMDALYYYRPDLRGTILDIREINRASRITYRASGDSGFGIRDSLTVIPYTVDIYGFDYGTVLGTMGYTRHDIKTVRMLTVETWSKK